MIKIFLVLFLISSQKIVLKDGRSFKDEIKYFKDSLLVLEEEGKISKKELQEIKFLPPPSLVSGFEDTIPIQEILEIAEEATQRFKDANGIILLENDINILNCDGTRTHRYHFIGKILKPEFRKWADKRIGFDETRDKVHILLARTIHPDGSISWFDRSKIKVSSSAQGMVYFSRYKTLSFNLPEVETQDIVEYVYEYEAMKPSDPKIFNPCGFLQSNEPTVRSKFKVIIPDSLELNFYTRNFSEDESAPKITNGTRETIYEWELCDIPGIVKEPKMPSLMDIVPGVFTTLFKDWEYIFDRHSKWQLRRMEVTSEIDSLCKETVKPAQSIHDSIGLIYHWVQQNIRYICIKGSPSSGHSGHPASLTLKNGFGDCTDKAILLATMLRAIGVDAYMIYVLTNSSGTAPLREIPISYSNHAINEIRLPDTTFWLDPVSETYRYPHFSSGDHGILYENPIAGRIDSILVPPPSYNARDCKINMTLNPQGDALVEFERKYTGGWEAWMRYRWKYTRESDYPHKIQEIINEESPGAELIDYEIGTFEDLSKQFHLKWEYKLKDYPTCASDLLIFKIPGTENYEFREASLSTRKYDIVYATSYEIRQNARIHLPATHKIESLPSSLKLSCKYASYEAEYKKLSDEEIEFHDKFSRWARIIPARDYDEYKQFLNKIASFAKQQIFLKKQ